MKKLKKQNAITLVALIITIIILLILAAISIQALTNQGLFTQAQNAKNLTEEKAAEENAILTNYLEQMNAIIGGQVTESVPDGTVVTPINDITTWLKTARISEQYSYTTIEQVITDSACTESLMNNENAMKYLARSTEFANAICASETAMTYLGQSVYVDDTVLNSDLWKQKIPMSPYWNEVSNITVTLHGGALETITITGLYGSPTVTTNSDGNVNYQLPIGTFTFAGAISGKSFERTVNKNTSDVYAMPESAVYWYGNLCTEFTGGLRSTTTRWGEDTKTCNPIITTKTNSYCLSYSASSYTYEYQYGSVRKIDLTAYTKLKGITTTSDTGVYGGCCFAIMDTDKVVEWPNKYVEVENNAGVKEYESDISGLTIEKNVVFCFRPSSHATLTAELYALWLE